MRKIDVSLDEIADHLDRVHHHGHYISACCPFHEDRNPSLLVFDDGWFKCLGCGEQGHNSRLYQKVSNVIGVQQDGGWTPPKLPYSIIDKREFVDKGHLFLRNNPFLHDYLYERGIGGMIDSCKLGWWNGWYIIPFFNSTNGLVGFTMRANKKLQKQIRRRYLVPPGQNSMLYVPDWKAVINSNYLIVTFGVIDAISLRTFGIPTASPSAGQLSSNLHWFDEIRKPIIFMPDKNEEESAWKIASQLGWRGHVLVPNYTDRMKDPNDMVLNNPSSLITSITNKITEIFKEN